MVSPPSLALRALRVCLKLGSQSMISQWMEWGTGYPIFKQTDVGETCLKMLGKPQNPCGLSSVFRSRLHLWGWSIPLLFWLNPWCTPYFLFLTRSFAATGKYKLCMWHRMYKLDAKSLQGFAGYFRKLGEGVYMVIYCFFF